ncbi:MAG: ChaN family lipoprotein [Thermonemataceae bacterium]|nr:ChaN family lipoprotein [Thermonemataceae bacterium]
MNKKYLIVLSLFALCMSAFNDKPAYQLFDQKGKKTSYETLLTEAQNADIVLFGELHNNPIAHWLQLQLSKDLATKKSDKLLMGAEMFEADNQLVFDEYQKGWIKETSFTKEAKIWDNYRTDYRGLVELAIKQKVPFVATNVPRRYASIVSKEGLQGLDKLDAEAKKFIAPLPIAFDANLPGYAEMTKMAAHGQMGGGAGKAVYFAQAQAIKDATMAHFILKNWQKGKIFIHFNGSYHSDNFEGIVWYLKNQNPSLKILTISTVEQDNISEISKENLEKANFILAIPSDMTKTY